MVRNTLALNVIWWLGYSGLECNCVVKHLTPRPSALLLCNFLTACTRSTIQQAMKRWVRAREQSYFTLIISIIGWVWASHTLVCSMTSFVCMIHMAICTYIESYVAAGVASSAGHLYSVSLLPPRVLCLSSSKYIQQWDHTGVTLTNGAGMDGCWDWGQMTHHIEPPTCCYHAHSTMFYSHLEDSRFNSECERYCLRLWSSTYLRLVRGQTFLFCWFSYCLSSLCSLGSLSIWLLQYHFLQE